jgi:hypothetical protein
MKEKDTEAQGWRNCPNCGGVVDGKEYAECGCDHCDYTSQPTEADEREECTLCGKESESAGEDGLCEQCWSSNDFDELSESIQATEQGEGEVFDFDEVYCKPKPIGSYKLKCMSEETLKAKLESYATQRVEQEMERIVQALERMRAIWHKEGGKIPQHFIGITEAINLIQTKGESL